MKLAAAYQLPNITVPTSGIPKININDPNLTIGNIIDALLPYVFTFAGILLLAYFVWGGIQLMTSRGDPKAVESAKGKITGALVGFVIVFLSYWIIQIIGRVLGIIAIKNIF